jgi:PHD/YefM family antitoxin component YafN of YafNO toxin-antitoxin module
MLETMKTISMSQLAKNAERIARDIESAGHMYRIKGPRGAMLLMDWEQYESWREMLALMRRPNWQSEWVQMERDASARRGRDLDTVVQELGLEVSTRSPRRGAARGTTAKRGTQGRKRAARSSRRSA